MIQKFTNEPLFEITQSLQKQLQELSSGEILEFEILNPDFFDASYSGKKIELQDKEYIYRSLKAYTDLCETLYCKMLVPIPKMNKMLLIRFKKLNRDISFHQEQQGSEKYGTNSLFAQIHKNEEPAFLQHYVQALKNININKRVRILNLGVNSAEEFEIIQKMCSNFSNMQLIGIDYSHSAIAEAQKKFPQTNIEFIQQDINTLDDLSLEPFDAIITIGTLQSSNIDFKLTFMKLVQQYLKKDGAMVLGFPNCRWIDGEMIYGAKVKNYSFSEMSLMIKDVHYCKKYLQQKKFKVTVTGKNYLFLSATSLKSERLV